jgi:hypothetical protein
MFLTDKYNIREVLTFPLMKDLEDGHVKEEKAPPQPEKPQ